MSRSHQLQKLILQSIRFWLPLLLLVPGFWLAGKFMTRQVVNQVSHKPRALVANTQTDEATTKITSIKVKIDRTRGISLVSVQLSNTALKRLEFEFPLTQPQEIEPALAQELARPLQEIKGLVRYQVSDR